MSSSSSTTFFLVTALAISIGTTYSEQWSYEDVVAWKTEYPICGSDTQSPIDFIPWSVIWNQTIPDFVFANYDAILNFTEFNLTNNGHSVQMNIADTSNASTGSTPFVISGGGLPSNYTLAQFHFHWGKDPYGGSEHTIEGGAYPMELHLVHWNAEKYPTFDVAANQTDGLAVIGVFVQVAEENSTVFDSLIKYFGNITFKNAVASDVPPFPLRQLLPDNTKDFYRYSGSLTTPPCYNSVAWTVFIKPINISQLQLEEFQSRLIEEAINETPRTKLADNFRATQPVHARPVYKTFEKVEWTYDELIDTNTLAEVAEWKLFFPKCGGQFQSPIDIQTDSVVQTDSLPKFIFTNYASIPSGTTFTLLNNGANVELVLGGEMQLKISGGGLSGEYILERVILHWGEDNGMGSDHMINSLSYPLEMQFLHYSSQYPNGSVASLHRGGLAILAVFFQATPENNSDLTPIWSELKHAPYPGNSTALVLSTLSPLIPANTMSFYRYDGSLTIPNCAETVNWTVFTDPIPISAKQMNMLRRHVYEDSVNYMEDNYRPIQNLNERKVLRSVVVTKTIPPRISKAPFPSTTRLLSAVLGCLVFYIASEKYALRLRT